MTSQTSFPFPISRARRPAGGSGDITVAKMVITLPDDYTQAELTWNQPVTRQPGATNPWTYVTPVVPGS
jgi:hypothetical protein